MSIVRVKNLPRWQRWLRKKLPPLVIGTLNCADSIQVAVGIAYNSREIMGKAYVMKIRQAPWWKREYLRINYNIRVNVIKVLVEPGTYSGDIVIPEPKRGLQEPLIFIEGLTG